MRPSRITLPSPAIIRPWRWPGPKAAAHRSSSSVRSGVRPPPKARAPKPTTIPRRDRPATGRAESRPSGPPIPLRGKRTTMLVMARWKVSICVFAVLFGVVFTLPNLLSQNTLDQFPSWLPHQKLNLGLDLQGGSSLLMEVDTQALKAERLGNLTESVRTTLREQ